MSETVTLARYDAAKRALAEAHRVDEVKDIRDKAIAVKAYAQQAKDHQLEEYAIEIRLRAERRAGELLREVEKNKGTRGQGRPQKGGRGERPPKDATPKLSDVGVTKDQSSKWQKLADMPEKEFEAKVADGKARKRPAKKKSKGRCVYGEDGKKKWVTAKEWEEQEGRWNEIKTELRAEKKERESARAAELDADAKATEARAGSWRVEITGDDGKRWVSGVRVGTKAEAGLYSAMSIHELSLKHHVTVTAMRVLSSDDPPRNNMRHPEKETVNGKERRPRNAGQLCSRLTFMHGECGGLRWHVEGEEIEPDGPAAA
jgi:hypothetical protein